MRGTAAQWDGSFRKRGEAICAAHVTERLPRGVAHAYESSAVYDPIGEPGKSADRGGCVNVLTNHRSQILRGSSMGPNACLIQIERWRGDLRRQDAGGRVAKAAAA